MVDMEKSLRDIPNKIRDYLRKDNKSNRTNGKGITKDLSVISNSRGDPTLLLPGAKVKKSMESDSTKHKSKFNWLYSPTKGVRWDFDPILLRNLAQSDPWVGMLVQTIAKEVAKTPWRIVEDEESIEKGNPYERKSISKSIDDSDEAQDVRNLLTNPNPDDNWYDLVYMMISDLLEVGSTCVVKQFDEKDYTSDELTSDDPTLLGVKASDPSTFTKEYQNKSGIMSGFWQYDKKTGRTMESGRAYQEPIQFNKDEIIWSDLNPKSNRRYGLPPTLMVKEILELLGLTIEQEQNYFSRGSTPSGMIVFDNWDIEEVQNWKEQNEEAIKGNPHKLLMLAGKEGSVSFEPFSFNFKELQFMEREEWYAKVIAASFRVPVSVVGLKPEKVNYNTFQGERENFESNTLGPYLSKIEDIVNDQIVREHFDDKIKFEFTPGMSESQKKNISDRVIDEWNNGAVTLNEVRSSIGYEQVEDEIGDKYKYELVDEEVKEFKVTDDTENS